MRALIDLLEKNQYRNVKTYLQTGNVIFEDGAPARDLGASALESKASALESKASALESKASAQRMEDLLEQEFGFRPEVLIINRSEFNAAVSDNPFNPSDGKQAHIYFCNSEPKPDIEKLNSLKAESEQYAVNGTVFYLHAPDGIGRSKLVANIEKHLGVSATGRNLNTVRKLLSLLE